MNDAIKPREGQVAATVADLCEWPRALAEVHAEFKAGKGGTVYKAYVPDGRRRCRRTEAGVV